jgi:hypothetical protein
MQLKEAPGSCTGRLPTETSTRQGNEPRPRNFYPLSPPAGLILLNEIVPCLRSAILSAVSFVGCVDVEELIQDATCIAARMLDSVEAREGLRRQAISPISRPNSRDRAAGAPASSNTIRGTP